MKRSYLLPLLAIVILTSCSRFRKAEVSVIPFVSDVIGNPADRNHQKLKSAVPGADGEICLIGSEESVIYLADVLAGTDDRDNATAALVSDGLPDFAGETVHCIVDTMHTQNHKLIADGAENILREAAARLTICAIDSIYHLTPYDEKGLGTRNPAKCIILTDPAFAQYGLSDARALIDGFKLNVPVIAPIDLMFEEALSHSLKSQNVAVVCDPSQAASGVYSARFRAVCDKMGRTGDECIILDVERNDGDYVKAFMDKYIDSGSEKAIDVILIDRSRIDLETVKTSLANIISLMNEESLVYRRYFSDDFRLIERGSTVSRFCYEYLRSSNLFTHYIQQPSVSVFYACGGNGIMEGETVLIPDTYVQN